MTSTGYRPTRVESASTLSQFDEDDDGEDTSQHQHSWKDPSLRQVAARACKMIDIGTAVMPEPLLKADVEDYNGSEELRDIANSMETRYARTIKHEFNAIVVEHHLKWAPLCTSEPGPLPGGQPSKRLGRYDFYYADLVVDWAIQHSLKVKGHVLVWHVTSPKFLEEMEPEEVREQLKRHIFTVMGHFRGRIKVWDVVNESLAPDGTLAENVFYRKLGPEYIEESFRWAHQADPEAILLYNDNKVEGIGSEKSDAFYELLATLKAKGVPIHGCGMQAHFNAAGTGKNRPPTPRMVKEQIKRIGKLGLNVNISEMDVRVSKLPEDLRELAQRQIYHDIIAAALSEPAFDGVWLWGFTDRHTWVSNFYYDDEPLIFDEEYRRKDSYFGVRDALCSLCSGHAVGGQGALLHSDVDANGNPWGYLWMQEDRGSFDEDAAGGGDSRPDWEQKDIPVTYTVGYLDTNPR